MAPNLSRLVARIAELEGQLEALRPARKRIIALAMIREKTVSADVLGQWIEILRRYYWPGPTFIMRPLYPVWGRNQLVAQALEDERPWTDLYWIDSDMLPDVRMAERLNELVEAPEYLAADGGVICGAYYGRGEPFEIQLFEKHPERRGLYFVSPERWLPALQEAYNRYLTNQPSRLLRIGGGGTGSMLIRRDVLERLQALKGRGNVFETPAIEPGLLEEMRRAGEDKPGATWSEDVYFCMEVAERFGIQVYADTDLRLCSAHLREDRVGPQHYVNAHQVLIRPGERAPANVLPGYEARLASNRAGRRAALRGK